LETSLRIAAGSGAILGDGKAGCLQDAKAVSCFTRVSLAAQQQNARPIRDLIRSPIAAEEPILPRDHQDASLTRMLLAIAVAVVPHTGNDPEGGR